ncbi:DUF6678 family protein [Hymenobacter lucidus]|uniref:Uncharacterized protein n=1 Tax=Hymenobacter lucidus TaxID=2880930 RepID=A0ABS8ATL7_9BACT|nr:DUF6678 family protein [Hymenobacter lucidus]MCB2409567.1 hypothetical protein [Hymenobacter lucidus]
MKAHYLIDKLNTEYKIQTRLKLFAADEVSPWASWFTVPVENYVEASTTGPYPLREVEWVEVNPFVVKTRGRLIMPHMLSYEQQIVDALEAGAIEFEQIGLVFRVYLS